MPRFLERKLKREYGANSDIPFMVMNKLGYMQGSRETSKGRKVERNYESKKRNLAKKHK